MEMAKPNNCVDVQIPLDSSTLGKISSACSTLVEASLASRETLVQPPGASTIIPPKTLLTCHKTHRNFICYWIATICYTAFVAWVTHFDFFCGVNPDEQWLMATLFTLFGEPSAIVFNCICVRRYTIWLWDGCWTCRAKLAQPRPHDNSTINKKELVYLRQPFIPKSYTVMFTVYVIPVLLTLGINAGTIVIWVLGNANNVRIRDNQLVMSTAMFLVLTTIGSNIGLMITCGELWEVIAGIVIMAHVFVIFHLPMTLLWTFYALRGDWELELYAIFATMFVGLVWISLLMCGVQECIRGRAEDVKSGDPPKTRSRKHRSTRAQRKPTQNIEMDCNV